MKRTRKYVLGMVQGEVVTIGGSDHPECCEKCGAGYHPYRPCRVYGASEPSEGHRGDE